MASLVFSPGYPGWLWAETALCSTLFVHNISTLLLSGFQAGAGPHDFLVRRPETFKLPGARPYFAEPAAVMSAFQFVPDPSSSALPLQVRRPRRDTSGSRRFSVRTGGRPLCGRVRGAKCVKAKQNRPR